MLRGDLVILKPENFDKKGSSLFVFKFSGFKIMKRTKLLKRRKRTKLLLIKFFITFLKEGKEGRSLVVCHDELKKLV